MKNRTWIIVGGVIVLVLVLAGVAALVTNSGDDNGDGGAAGGLAQTQPVEIAGDPLPPMPEDPSAADPAIGLPAPTINGATFDGTPMTIGGATGNPTMLVFLAHWCPHCNNEIPVLNQLKDDGQIPDGLDVIGITTATNPQRPFYPPSEWIVDKDWTWPVMTDSDGSEAFIADGGTGFPYLLLLDADGDVLARTEGEHSGADLTQWLQTALAGTPATATK